MLTGLLSALVCRYRGQIMAAVKASGADEDTITFFTSDNGAPVLLPWACFRQFPPLAATPTHDVYLCLLIYIYIFLTPVFIVSFLLIVC